MVEKKRFDGSDAMDTTGMLRALRARATASGAVRGVTAAMASVAAMAMLGAVCVTPRGGERRRGRVRRPVRDFRDASGRERCDGRR